MSADETRSGLASVAVLAEGEAEDVRIAAESLADELGLPFVSGDRSISDAPDLLLVVHACHLELREARRNAPHSVFVDFAHGPVGYRRKSGRSRRQPIAQAVGLRRGPMTVVDATAGLARDSFLLACLGCDVIAIERSVVLGALVRDGLRRAAAEGDADLDVVLDRITLIVDDARAVLPGMTGTHTPDVVYMDPMYPPKKKTALPKMEMRICRRLVGDDPDAGELLGIARRVAARRVVVKRHPAAPPLAPDPVIRFTGRQVRYDVYHPVT